MEITHWRKLLTGKQLKSVIGLVGLVSLFYGISTLFRLFNAKAILLEEQYYLTHSWEDKGVHTFPQGICPKVNIIARLENELAYYDSTVHHCNHEDTPAKKSVIPALIIYIKSLATIIKI